MVDESISGFLETVAKHPALTNNKDSLEPGHKEQCSELYIQLLEKVFEFFDKIPISLKENIPGYDRFFFEQIKLLQIKLKQILAKPDSVSAQGSQSVIDTDSANESVLESSRLHSICIQNGAHNSATLTFAPRSLTPQGQGNDLLLKNYSSVNAFTPLKNASYSVPPSSQGKGEKNSVYPKLSRFTTEQIESTANKNVPLCTADRTKNASKNLKRLTPTEAIKCAPVAKNFARFQRPPLSKSFLLNNNRPSTDSVKDNKDSEPRGFYSVPINMGNYTNVTPEAAEVRNNSVSGATSSSHVEERNRLFSVPVFEFGGHRYREEDFETRNRNLSEQVEGAKNYLFKKPPSDTIESNKEVPPSSSERMRNAVEILKPLTSAEAPKRAPALQNFARFQRPQLNINSLLNNNRPSTDSVKDNKDSKPMDDCDVPINMGNDINVTPEAAEVSNYSVSGASSSNEEERFILFDEPVDEYGWQRYREEDFETENKIISEQVIGQEHGKFCLIKKPPIVTIYSNKELPSSTAETIRNAAEIIKPLTATGALKCAPVAQSPVEFQPPQLLNSNRHSTDSVKDNKDCEPSDYGVPINMGNNTNVPPEAAEVSNNSVSGAVSSSHVERNRLFDVPVDEFGWQQYKEEDFETRNRNLSKQVKGAKNDLFKKPPSVTIESNKEVPPSSSERMRNAVEILKPLTAAEAPKRAPALQNFARFQGPQLSKNSLPNNNRLNTDSFKKNNDSKLMDDCDVLIKMGNDTNFSPEEAEVSNYRVSGASSSTVEEGIILFDVPVDEYGWQRYRVEDFETANRNISEQVLRQERDKNYLIKKPPSVTIDSNKELPSSTAETIRNAPEMLKPLTATVALKCAPVAQSPVEFQPPQLLNSNRHSTDSVKDDKDCEPSDYGVPINMGNDTNVPPEAAEVSNNSVSVAASSSY